MKRLLTVCPYCHRVTGEQDIQSLHHNWCRRTECDLRGPKWFQYVRFIAQPFNLNVGSVLFSIFTHTDQLKEVPMSTQTLELIHKLSGMTYPNPEDLLKLHQLLQEPENKAQVLSTPDQLMMLHQTLSKIADDTTAKLAAPRTKKNKETGDTKKALDAWIGTESDDEDLDLV